LDGVLDAQDGPQPELKPAVTTSLRIRLSLFAVAYLSIVREGVETSIFLWSEAKTTGGGVSAWLGATLGLLAAATLGWLIYRGMLRFNLGKFFTYTGAYLLVLTAGIFAYALGEFTELGFLPETSSAYDFTAVTPEGSPIEIALKGTLGYLPNPSWIQCAAWVGFVAISLALYLRKPAKRTSRSRAYEPMPDAHGCLHQALPCECELPQE